MKTKSNLNKNNVTCSPSEGWDGTAGNSSFDNSHLLNPHRLKRGEDFVFTQNINNNYLINIVSPVKGSFNINQSKKHCGRVRRRQHNAYLNLVLWDMETRSGSTGRNAAIKCSAIHESNSHTEALVLRQGCLIRGVAPAK